MRGLTRFLVQIIIVYLNEAKTHVTKEWASWLSLKRIFAVIQPFGQSRRISESRKRSRYSAAVSFRSFDQLKHSAFK